jgi:hypothetical protein
MDYVTMSNQGELQADNVTIINSLTYSIPSTDRTRSVVVKASSSTSSAAKRISINLEKCVSSLQVGNPMIVVGTEDTSTKSTALNLNNEAYTIGVSYSLTPALDPTTESALSFSTSTGIISYSSATSLIPPTTEHTLNALIGGIVIAKQVINIINIGDQITTQVDRVKAVNAIVLDYTVLKVGGISTFKNLPTGVT